MHIAVVTMSSKTPYSQSRAIDKLEVPPKPKETNDLYEERTWRHRIHSRKEDNRVFIPRTCFERAIQSAARRLQLQIPGKGKTQYTKYFEAGIQVVEDLLLDVKAEDVVGERLFVPADGKPGGGKRVYRRFPRIESWSGDITVLIHDDIISEDVFTQVIRSAGLLVGVGRFRPENRGFYGRFKVDAVKWVDDPDSSALARLAS